MEIYVIMGKVRKRKHIEKCYLLSNDFFYYLLCRIVVILKTFFMLFSQIRNLFMCAYKKL